LPAKTGLYIGVKLDKIRPWFLDLADSCEDIPANKFRFRNPERTCGKTKYSPAHLKVFNREEIASINHDYLNYGHIDSISVETTSLHSQLLPAEYVPDAGTTCPNPA